MVRHFRSALALMGLLAMAGGARAETQWDKDHPRRAEVNSRLEHQDNRIRTEREQGEISGAQAKTLHKDDQTLRIEERNMAAKNGGHITSTEQKALNRQENQVGKEIGK